MMMDWAKESHKRKENLLSCIYFYMRNVKQTVISILVLVIIIVFFVLFLMLLLVVKVQNFRCSNIGHSKDPSSSEDIEYFPV